MTSRNIRTDALDFEEIKENIKEFLRGQSDLTDYDFDGSAMSIFLDVLAYNTHYNSLYTNLAVNEMFIDSASKYSSVVSLAKTLGYTAKSFTSAKAKINVTITAPFTQETRIIPAGTIFSGTVGAETFEFITRTDTSAQGFTPDNINGIYRFYDVELIEGTRLTKRYTALDGSQFVVPNLRADISTLMVKVQENASSSVYTGFGPAENILNVNSQSNVFFVKQREDLYYEVYFGNGIIGKNINNGNVVQLSYVLSSGESANGSRAFVYNSRLDFPVDSVAVETVTEAYGGSNAEDIESIRFNAPRAFASQNRAVTAEDYKNVLYNNFPTIETITTWGGQGNDPPIYGKVFISAKPVSANTFSVMETEEMVNFLKNSKGVVSVTPVFVDPKFIRIELTSNVYYNRNAARRSVGEIQSIIARSISSYSESLGKFGSVFRHSKVVSLINEADDAITSNITTIRLRVGVSPFYNKNIKYDVKLANPVFQNPNGGSFFSTRFFINSATITDRCYLTDDGKGVIRLLAEDSTGKARFIRNVGTIDYKKGSVSVNDVSIRGLFDDLLEFVFVPLSNDVIPTREYILQLPDSLVTVNMLIDPIESAGTTNAQYRFTASR